MLLHTIFNLCQSTGERWADGRKGKWWTVPERHIKEKLFIRWLVEGLVANSKLKLTAGEKAESKASDDRMLLPEGGSNPPWWFEGLSPRPDRLAKWNHALQVAASMIGCIQFKPACMSLINHLAYSCKEAAAYHSVTLLHSNRVIIRHGNTVYIYVDRWADQLAGN